MALGLIYKIHNYLYIRLSRMWPINNNCAKNYYDLIEIYIQIELYLTLQNGSKTCVQN